MQDAGFIALSYVLTLGSMALFAVVTVRRARSLSRTIPDRDKPWL
jgi:heme exporter protein D